MKKLQLQTHGTLSVSFNINQSTFVTLLMYFNFLFFILDI